VLSEKIAGGFFDENWRLMKKIFYFGLLIASGSLIVSSCTNADSANSNRPSANNSMVRATPSPAATMETANSNKPAMGDDFDFMTTAELAGLAEVELGKLAQTKAQNAEVKKFAAMMVTDHTKAGDELKAFGKKKDFKPATEMDSAHKATMEKLKGLSGAEFDKAYVDAMIDDHEDAVDLFEGQAKDGKDAELKAFAAKTLPTLQSHLKMINDIKAKLK
jgi:putative membrane protein